MKKFFVATAMLLTVFMFAVCGCNGAGTAPTENGVGNGSSETEQPATDNPNKDNQEISAMYLYINDNKIEVTLAKNSSVDALTKILKNGDIVYTADDYGGFEKVGDIGYSLPGNDEPINTSAGDVILYQGNNICLYYGNNSWTFTRIGKINGYSAGELRTLLCAGSGSVQVRISLKG